jgi:hypothetical protein
LSASIQSLNPLSVQPGSMQAQLLCEHFFKTLSPKTTVKSMLHTHWTSVYKFLSDEQESSVQVLESSNDQDHADANVACRSIDASEEAIGDDSIFLCLNAPCKSCVVAQVANSLAGFIPGDWSCQCP